VRRWAAVLALVGLGLAPGGAGAQGWELEARGGQLRLGPGTTAAASLAIGVRYMASDALFFVGAGLPLGEGHAVWGEAGAWRRAGITWGPLFLGADVTGSGVALREEAERPRLTGGLGSRLVPTSGEPDRVALAGAVQALPVLAVGGPALRLEARTGASWYGTVVGGEGASRTVLLSDLALTASPAPVLALEPRLTWVDTPEETHLQASVTAFVNHRRGALWASAGHWLSEDAGPTWAAGARVAISSRAIISASARRTTLDPLYLTPPQTA
jgi:hypothetical protein